MNRPTPTPTNPSQAIPTPPNSTSTLSTPSAAKSSSIPGRSAGEDTTERRGGQEGGGGGGSAAAVTPPPEKAVDRAVEETFPASDPTSTQREKPGAGDAPPDLSHRLPPVTPAEQEAVANAREAKKNAKEDGAEDGGCGCGGQ